MTYKLDFSTSHHQFYLADQASPKDTGEDDFWTEESTYSRLAVGEGILGIGLECYGPFRGELVVLDKKKDDVDFRQFDHIVEGGISIQSGILQVLNCPDTNLELELKVNPGTYRVRIYSSNLASVEGDEGDDYYKIEVWPDSNMERTVLKQYH